MNAVIQRLSVVFKKNDLFLLDRPRTIMLQKRDFQAGLKQQRLNTLQIMN